MTPHDIQLGLDDAAELLEEQIPTTRMLVPNRSGTTQPTADTIKLRRALEAVREAKKAVEIHLQNSHGEMGTCNVWSGKPA
jgi:hypothetical protein